jgi:hypothetical protein
VGRSCFLNVLFVEAAVSGRLVLVAKVATTTRTRMRMVLKGMKVTMKMIAAIWQKVSRMTSRQQAALGRRIGSSVALAYHWVKEVLRAVAVVYPRGARFFL